MGFSSQGYWGRLPCPSPGDLPDPGIESASLMSPALAGVFFEYLAVPVNSRGESVVDQIQERTKRNEFKTMSIYNSFR